MESERGVVLTLHLSLLGSHKESPFDPPTLAFSHLGNGMKLSPWVIAHLVCRGLKPPATINSPSGAGLQALEGAFEM